MKETIIDLRQFENVLNPIYAAYLYIKTRYLILYGGAGAGKSHFACQKILYRIMNEEGHRFLIIRKVARTLRASVFQLFLDYINKWELSSEFKINKTDMTITFEGNGNMILFAGVDDPEKLKSIEGITGIWIEEANELYLKDFQELDRRLRGIFQVYVQIILTYNPILKTNWTYLRFFSDVTKKDLEDITRLRTTYKDNVFIKEDKAYKKLLEGYTGNMRTVFTLGRYGMLENAIYINWEMIDDDKFPQERAICGLDFGFINPNCLLKIIVDLDRKEIWVHELIYKRHQIIPELSQEMDQLGLNDYKIIADSEAPEKIEEIKRDGFPYIEGSKKGKGSVLAGIDYVQQFKIFITRSSVNVKKEIEVYQRRKDKDGNVLEAPEEGFDHAMACIRYVMYTVYYMLEPEAPIEGKSAGRRLTADQNW
jgi:phage terminase large subunit